MCLWQISKLRKMAHCCCGGASRHAQDSPPCPVAGNPVSVIAMSMILVVFEIGLVSVVATTYCRALSDLNIAEVRCNVALYSRH